jgi:hypothetical protein
MDWLEYLFFIVAKTGNLDYLANQAEFTMSIFPQAFWLFLIVGLSTAAVFYLVVNNLTPNFSGWGSWVIFMAISGIICSIIAYKTAMNVLALFEADGSVWLFTLNAFIVGMFIFFLGFVFKFFSKHADKTPF